MKALVHILAALALFLMTITIHWLHYQSNLLNLDTVRIRRREKIGMELARAKDVLTPTSPYYPSQSCRDLTNLTKDPACLAKRQAMQAQIRTYTNCNKYKSQSCSFMDQALQTLAQQNASGFYWGRVINDDYTQALTWVIHDSPTVFRNAYSTIQEKWLIISRSYLYLYLDTAVLANLLFHIIDYFLPVLEDHTVSYTWGPLLAKTFTMLATIFIPAGQAMSQSHNANIMVLLTIPAAISFLWFEILLPKEGRPWYFLIFVMF